jgi:hypothetical protein
LYPSLNEEKVLKRL